MPTKTLARADHLQTVSLSQDYNQLLAAIAAYWNEHIHDLEIATHPIGAAEFFEELADYRYDKLDYLPQVVDFARYQNQRLLEIGCGVGLDLAGFAQAGTNVTGVDLAPVSIDLAWQNFAQQELVANLYEMNGEQLAFTSNSFDAVYAHGVLQYTANPQQMIAEIWRVLRPGGQAILMVYNRYSWLNAMSVLTGVGLEHTDAPVLRKFSISEFKTMLTPFARVEIIPERFPVKTQLHHGLKALLYNRIFVNSFNLLPRTLVKPLGWHLMAFAYKE